MLLALLLCTRSSRIKPSAHEALEGSERMLPPTAFTLVFKERFLFFKRWLDNPLQLGALAPSSKALGEMIAEQVVEENREALKAGGCVLELGAGTGVFTEALLKAGVPSSQLVCVELDDFLHTHLTKNFPEVLVLKGSACSLEEIVPPFIQGKVAAVVSGIPMMNISRLTQSQIIRGVFEIIVPGGRMYQFTYSPFSSIAARNFELKKRRLGTVFLNFPPATVWTYERSAQA